MQAVLSFWPPDLELGTEGKGKYEEGKREKGKHLKFWRAKEVFIVPERCAPWRQNHYILVG